MSLCFFVRRVFFLLMVIWMAGTFKFILARLAGRDPIKEQMLQQIASFLVGIAAGQLLWGPLSDRFGRRPALLWGLAVFLAASFLCTQAGSVGEWPEGLYEAEVRVAAFQNGYYAALVNRVGCDGSLEFAGESFVADPAGRVVARAPGSEDHLLVVDLDYGALETCHARRLFYRDRRADIVPQLLASPQSPVPSP